MPIVIEVNRTDAPTPTPQPSRNLYRVKADQYTYSWDFAVRPVVADLGSAPAVNRTGDLTNPANFLRSPFTRAWQFFWADVLAVYRYQKVFSALPSTERNYIVRVFNSLTLHDKYLTNRAGTNTHNNYITGDIRGEDPKIDPLICAGSLVEVLEARKSTSGVTNGLTMARLNTFAHGDAPPAVTYELVMNDPRILWATVIYPDGHLTPFPNFEGAPVPYPYIARHPCWYPLRDLEKV